MGLSPQADGVNLAPGLGLTNAVIIDQHFSQRDRLGRLLTAVSYNPFLLGVGIDEDTAIFIPPDRVFEVEGSGSVTIEPYQSAESGVSASIPVSSVMRRRAY